MLIRGLVSAGCEVGILMDRPPPAVHDVPIFPWSYPPDEKMPKQFQDALAEFVPDCVHIIGLGINDLQRFVTMKPAIPWLLTVHSVPPFERILKGLYTTPRLHVWVRNLKFAMNRILWKRVFRQDAPWKVIVHSPFVADCMRGVGCKAERLIEIPIAVELLERNMGVHALDTVAPRIVTVAGIAYTKGLHDGIRAIALLRQSYPGIRYDIVGEPRDSKYRAFLERLIDQHQLRGTVEFRLQASMEVRNQLLQNADLYLQPSHEEGFCMAYAEAASIVPRLIGTHAGAIAQISDDDPNMCIVPYHAPEEIAKAAEHLLQRNVSSEALQSRRERLARSFSVDTYIQQHLAAYRTTMAKHSTAAMVS